MELIICYQFITILFSITYSIHLLLTASVAITKCRPSKIFSFSFRPWTIDPTSKNNKRLITEQTLISSNIKGASRSVPDCFRYPRSVDKQWPRNRYGQLPCRLFRDQLVYNKSGFHKFTEQGFLDFTFDSRSWQPSINFRIHLKFFFCALNSLMSVLNSLKLGRNQSS